MKNFMSVLALALLMTLLPTSCNKEKSDYNKAKKSESIEVLKNYLTEYPGGMYADSANTLIEKLTWQQALLKDRTADYEDYLDNYPDGKYVNDVIEQMEYKKKNLGLALEAYNKAQQADDETELEELYARADSLFNLVNFTDFIIEGFKMPTINLYLDQEGRLSEDIPYSFTTTRYLYGSPVSEIFTHKLGDEKISDYIFYKVLLGSANVTGIKISIQLIRDGKIVAGFGEDGYIVSSNRYSSYIGVFHKDGIDFMPGDRLRFVINATGSNYGKSCGYYESYIKAVEPAVDLDNDILAERKRAIEWCVSNSRWTHPAAPLMDFIAQLDYCVLNNKNAVWNFGSGSQKDGESYQVFWENDSLKVNKLTVEDIDELGIEEGTFSFSTL